MGVRATWKIIDRGEVPADAKMIPFECGCGRVAMLPVVGTAIAAVGGFDHLPEAIIFDNTEAGKLPHTVQCRKCRRTFTTEGGPDVR